MELKLKLEQPIEFFLSMSVNESIVNWSFVSFAIDFS